MVRTIDSLSLAGPSAVYRLSRIEDRADLWGRTASILLIVDVEEPSWTWNVFLTRKVYMSLLNPA